MALAPLPEYFTLPEMPAADAMRDRLAAALPIYTDPAMALFHVADTLSLFYPAESYTQ